MPQIIEPNAIPYGGPHRTTDQNAPRTLTNPLTEDFKFSWGDVPYTVKAGQTITFPEFLAVHGAKHLSMFILSSRRKTTDPTDNVVLYDETEVDDLMGQLLDVDSKKEESVKETQKFVPTPQPTPFDQDETNEDEIETIIRRME